MLKCNYTDKLQIFIYNIKYLPTCKVLDTFFN